MTPGGGPRPGRAPGLVALAAPLLLASLGVILWASLADLPFTPSRRRIGPDVWPKLVLGLLLIACAWRVIELLLQRGAGEGRASLERFAGREPAALEPVQAAGLGATARALGGIAVLLAYAAALPALGFLVASFLLMAAVMALGGLRRPGLLLGVAAFGSLGFFAAFQKLVYLSLPMGEGPFRDATLFVMTLIGVR